MTVLENVMTARHLRTRQSLADAIVGTPTHHAEERRSRERAMELLRILGLEEQAGEHATSLPYGSQRRLEIARALATDPRLLLLDEPAAGMNPEEALELARLIRWLRDELRLTVLLVEHNMKVVMSICERIQVIDYGETIAVGTADEIRRTTKVVEAYLGDDETAGG
jgi:branched-chain amino acid transport system ATP-binding protein